jgi:hypothetical protein
MTEGTKQEELKYHERLDIPTLSIGKIKELIKTDFRNTINAWQKRIPVQRQAFHIIGPAGVGKTQICGQLTAELAEELKLPFEMIMIKGPVLSRDDFLTPYPVLTDKFQMTGRFNMLYSDFVPRRDSKYGLFVIDEFSRADHNLQQLLWQVQNEYAVHNYAFPEGWFVVSTDNPDDAEYQMDTMEDAAGLRRHLHIFTEVSALDFLKYAVEQNFHPFVVEFIQTHPEYIYDFDAQRVGSVFANPASYEKLSDHLKKFEANGGVENHFDDIETIAAGLINTHMTRMFISFAKDKKDINPKDVFYKFDEVKPKIEAILKAKEMDRVAQLMTGFTMFMLTSRPKYEDRHLKNIEDFMLMMPVDTTALFVTMIDGYSRTSEEFKYMTDIHVIMMKKSDKWKKLFYEPLVAVGRNR